MKQLLYNFSQIQKGQVKGREWGVKKILDFFYFLGLFLAVKAAQEAHLSLCGFVCSSVRVYQRCVFKEPLHLCTLGMWQRGNLANWQHGNLANWQLDNFANWQLDKAYIICFLH